MKLQGVGMDEWRRYRIDTLKPKQLADFCGNAQLAFYFSIFSDGSMRIVDLTSQIYMIICSM